MICFCLGEKFEEKVFLLRSLLQVLPVFSGIYWAFRRKKWGLCCQNRVLNVLRNNSRKDSFGKKPSFFSFNFSFWANFFQLSVGSFSAGLSKLQSTYLFYFFKENTLFWNNYVFFITVRVPAENFGLFAKIFRPFCEYCFRRVQQKNLRKTFFNTFGVRATYFLTVDWKFSAFLSKLLSTSLEESFAGLFFLHSNFLKPCWSLAKSFRQVPKVRFQWPEEHFEG